MDKLLWKPGITKFDEIQWQKATDAIQIIEDELNYSKVFNFSLWKYYMYMRNCKTLVLPTDTTGWTGIGSTLSKDSSDFWYGDGCLKATRVDSGAGYCGMTSTFSAIDLTKFNDGNESTTNDAISISYYFSNTTMCEYFELRIGTDSDNFYKVAIIGGLQLSDWQSLVWLKSQFQKIGNPDWSNVIYFDFRIYKWSDFQGEYVKLQYVGLTRKDIVKNTVNPLQEYNPNTGIFQYISGLDYNDYRWIMVGDPPMLVNIRMSASMADPKLTLSTQSYSKFLLKGSIICKMAGYCGGFGFYIDSLNYIYCHIANNVFIVVSVKNGITVTYSCNTNSIAVDTRVKYMITRVNNSLRFIINPGLSYIIELKELYNNDLANIYYITPNRSKYGLLEDYLISNEETDILNVGGLAI